MVDDPRLSGPQVHRRAVLLQLLEPFFQSHSFSLLFLQRQSLLVQFQRQGSHRFFPGEPLLFETRFHRLFTAWPVECFLAFLL